MSKDIFYMTTWIVVLFLLTISCLYKKIKQEKRENEGSGKSFINASDADIKRFVNCHHVICNLGFSEEARKIITDYSKCVDGDIINCDFGLEMFVKSFIQRKDDYLETLWFLHHINLPFLQDDEKLSTQCPTIPIFADNRVQFHEEINKLTDSYKVGLTVYIALQHMVCEFGDKTFNEAKIIFMDRFIKMNALVNEIYKDNPLPKFDIVRAIEEKGEVIFCVKQEHLKSLKEFTREIEAETMKARTDLIKAER